MDTPAIGRPSASRNVHAGAKSLYCPRLVNRDALGVVLQVKDEDKPPQNPGDFFIGLILTLDENEATWTWPDTRS